jgi:hypothetical protein
LERLLYVHDTLHATVQMSIPRSSLARPPFPFSAGRNPGDGGGAFGGAGAFPGYACRTIPAPGCAPRSPRVWSCFSVAYSLPAISRLGYSPELPIHRAYHNTLCEPGSNTNQCRDKKTGGLPCFRPGPSLSLSSGPVAATRSPLGETAPIAPPEFPVVTAFIFIIIPTQKDYLHV